MALERRQIITSTRHFVKQVRAFRQLQRRLVLIPLANHDARREG
jgi:hypothetical protein